MSSDIAEEGTLLHAIMAEGVSPAADYAVLESYRNLTPDQQILIDRACAIEVKLLKDCFASEPCDVMQEMRLWYTNENGERVFSGRFDKVYMTLVEPKKALIIEYKFGFIPVANVAENIQERAYAVLLNQEFGVGSIFAAIIQPRCSAPLELCHYAAHDLERAEIELTKIIETAQSENAARRAGEKQCKYCRAKTVCPEARGVVEALVPIETNAASIEKGVQMLPGEALSQLYDSCLIAEDVIAAVKTEIKSRLTADPNSVPNCWLKPGNTVRKVDNVVEAFKRVEKAGVKASDFMGICTVPIGKLETLFAKAKNLKGDFAKTEFNSALEGIIKPTQNQPSLERIAA